MEGKLSLALSDGGACYLASEFLSMAKVWKQSPVAVSIEEVEQVFKGSACIILKICRRGSSPWYLGYRRRSIF